MSHPAHNMSGMTRYSTVAIILHWVIALGIITLIAMGLIMDHLSLDPARVFQLYQLHKSLGITVMLLVFVRIGWRLTHQVPPLPADMPQFEKTGAHIAHIALYGFQLLLPLTGWALVSASVFGIPTVLFGYVPWPDLPILPTLSNKAMVEAALKLTHHWASWVFSALIILHIAAALRHKFILHDHVLDQMLLLFKAPSSADQKGKIP